MATQSIAQITLHLDEAEHFFLVPDRNPLRQKAIYESGVETVFSQVKASHLRDSIQLILFLPPDQVTPDLRAQIKAALDDYCQYKINDIQRSLIVQWRAGRRTLWGGLIILAICLVLSALGGVIVETAVNNWVKGLGGFMYNGFMIIGWVSLWTPTSMLLFDWWPDRVSQKTYERMRNMAIEIRPEPPAIAR